MVRTEIIVITTRTQNVLGEKGQWIQELTSVIQKRFYIPGYSVDFHTVGESLHCKLLGGPE